MFGPLAICIIVLYFLALGGIAYYSHKKSVASPDDYFIAGRTVNTFVLVLTVSATFFSMYSFIGAYGITWRIGINFINQGWWCLVFIGWTIYVVGPRLWLLGRRYKFITPAQLLAEYYGSGVVRSLVVFICIVGIFPYAVIQFIGAGKTLVGFTDGDISYVQGLALFLVITGAYVFFGGFRAVVLSDVLQGLFFGSVMLGTPVWLIYKMGGLENMSAFFQQLAVTKPHLVTYKDTIWPWFLRTALILGFGFICVPHIWQRMYSAANIKTLHKTAFLVPIWSFVLCMPILLIGILAHQLLPEITTETSGFLFPMLFKKYAPIAGAFIIAAAFAAGMSTVDSVLLSSSSIFEEDVYREYINSNADEKKRANVGRWFIIVFLGAITMFSFSQGAQTLIAPIAEKGMELCSMLWPAMLGPLFWPRATKEGAIASLVVGIVIVCGSMVPGLEKAVLPSSGIFSYSATVAYLASFTAFFIVSYLTKPLPYSKQEDFHGYLDSVLHEAQLSSEKVFTA